MVLKQSTWVQRICGWTPEVSKAGALPLRASLIVRAHNPVLKVEWHILAGLCSNSEIWKLNFFEYTALHNWMIINLLIMSLIASWSYSLKNQYVILDLSFGFFFNFFNSSLSRCLYDLSESILGDMMRICLKNRNMSLVSLTLSSEDWIYPIHSDLIVCT